MKTRLLQVLKLIKNQKPFNKMLQDNLKTKRSTKLMSMNSKRDFKRYKEPYVYIDCLGSCKRLQKQQDKIKRQAKVEAKYFKRLGEILETEARCFS